MNTSTKAQALVIELLRKQKLNERTDMLDHMNNEIDRCHFIFFTESLDDAEHFYEKMDVFEAAVKLQASCFPGEEIWDTHIACDVDTDFELHNNMNIYVVAGSEADFIDILVKAAESYEPYGS